MRRLIATGIIALNTFTILNLPASVRAEDERDCTAALSKAQRQIETGRSVDVSIRISDISEGYPDHPDGRPMSYEFVLQGTASGAIMNSPKFMKAIATNVIQNCGSVGVVHFGVWGSGWGSSVGVLPSGQLDFFQCVDFEERNPPTLSWGQEVCNL